MLPVRGLCRGRGGACSGFGVSHVPAIMGQSDGPLVSAEKETFKVWCCIEDESPDLLAMSIGRCSLGFQRGMRHVPFHRECSAC